MKYYEDSETIEYLKGKEYFIHCLDPDAFDEDDYEEIKSGDPKALKSLRKTWDEGEYESSGTVILYKSDTTLVVHDHSADWYDDNDTLPVSIEINSLTRALKALDLAAKDVVE